MSGTSSDEARPAGELNAGAIAGTRRLLERVRGFLIGAGFPAFAIGLLLSAVAFMLAVLLLPESDSAAGAFAREFRTWCFGFGPAGADRAWAGAFAMVSAPLLMSTVIAALWLGPLRAALARPLSLLAPALAGLAVVASGVVALSTLTPGRDRDLLAFPAESLRTEVQPPAFSLTNQDGTTVSLGELRGRVVLVTSVYASCGYACPRILAQTRRAVDALTDDQRADLRVAAITMDPEHDTQAVLAAMAKAQGVQAPLYNLLTGPPDDVENLLDRFGVSRKRDPETGVIDHANLFLLVDRDGLLAYRFTLGDGQERWMIEALRLLLTEHGGAA